MSSKVIHLAAENASDIRQTANALKREINAELIYENLRTAGETQIYLLSFEKFYFRNGSYASLTVMLVQNDDRQTADIIGSGGGEGIFNISWGANSDFAEMAEYVLKQRGFKTER